MPGSALRSVSPDGSPPAAGSALRLGRVLLLAAAVGALLAVLAMGASGLAG